MPASQPVKVDTESNPVPAILLFIVVALVALGFYVYHANKQRQESSKEKPKKKVSKKKTRREAAGLGPLE